MFKEALFRKREIVPIFIFFGLITIFITSGLVLFSGEKDSTIEITFHNSKTIAEITNSNQSQDFILFDPIIIAVKTMSNDVLKFKFKIIVVEDNTLAKSLDIEFSKQNPYFLPLSSLERGGYIVELTTLEGNIFRKSFKIY